MSRWYKSIAVTISFVQYRLVRGMDHLAEVVTLRRPTRQSADQVSLLSVKLTSKIRDQINLIQERYEELRKVIENGNSHRLEELLSKPQYSELLNYADAVGQTLLHFAADLSDANCVRVILDAGGDFAINSKDNEGRIPLHLVLDGGCRCENCTRKNADCVTLLLNAGSNVDEEDEHQETPLYLSAKYMMPNCATLLLKNGADIGKKSGDKNKNVRLMVVQKIPEVMSMELDKGVRFDESDSSVLDLDFTILLQSAVSDDPTSTKVDKTKKETDLLCGMLKAHKAGREKLLTHPLAEAFLHVKWKAVRKWFLAIRIFYFLMTIMYTTFVFNVFLTNCHFPKNNETETYASATATSDISNSNGSIYVEDGNGEDEEIPCKRTPYMYTMTGFVLLFTLIGISNEIYEMVTDFKSYFYIGLNYAWWILHASVILTVLPAMGVPPQEWQYPLAAFGIFYAWAMTLTQIGRMPSIGVYVEMLGKVLHDFAIFAFTFAALLIGFALGFCVLFPWDETFRNVPTAFMKVLLIMIGETDYENLFDEDLNPQSDNLEYSIFAHIIFAGFVILVTIVLMNLLLGLAVSDIQELQKIADLHRITREIQQIALFETLIYSQALPRPLRSWLINRFSIISLASTRGRLFSLKPGDPDDRSLPEPLKARFIPYLTQSPCLNAAKTKKNLIASRFFKAKDAVRRKKDNIDNTNNNVASEDQLRATVSGPNLSEIFKTFQELQEKLNELNVKLTEMGMQKSSKNDEVVI